MERQLNYKHLKQGFSLLEVVISLLIVSITFLAYSQLIDQNLKAQDLKQAFVEESNLKANLLTLYVIDPDVDDYIVQGMLNVDDIEQTQLSRYQNVREIEIKIEHPGSETTLIIYK
jgi:prepilin-type N-terminal cleavage/methylation domain-containing protein